MRQHTGPPTYPDLLAHPVRRILVLKPRAIGDVILSTIVTRNLRDAFPDAVIDFMTESPARAVIEGNPYISNAVIFQPKRDNILEFFLRLRRGRYDLVFDLFCNPRTAQMTFVTGARYRVGYPFRGRAWAYNIRVPGRTETVHNAIFNLDPLTLLGIPTPDRTVHFPRLHSAEAWAGAFLANAGLAGGILVALNPGGAWSTKRWGLDNFALLGDELFRRHNARVILLHGPGELSDAEYLRTRMTCPAIIPPPSTLPELGALLARCDFLVSNDSSPLHIAAAVGTPVLGIYGPTNPQAQGPFTDNAFWVRNETLDCLSCNKTTCPIGNVCMRELGVETVLSAFEKLMGMKN